MKSTRQQTNVPGGSGTPPAGKYRSGKAQTTSRVGEGRFRLAFENAPIGLAIVGLDYRLRRVNKSLCEALGYEMNELLGRRYVEITHPDDVERNTALAGRLFRGEIPSYRTEARFVKKDGQLAWLDVTAVVIRKDQEEPIYGLAMIENITERKRAQEALRTSEERYRSFVVNSSEGIWRVEVEQPIDTSLPADEQIRLFYKYGYLAECNDALARMYGHERADDMIGARFGDFALAANPASVSSIRKLISSGYRLVDLQTEEFDTGMTRKHFSTSVIGIVINGALLRVWGVRRDQTEQRHAEQELDRSHQQLRVLSAHLQSLREKERTELAREIHDTLGQSLTSINIEVSLLRKNLQTAGEGGRSQLDEKLDEIGRLVTETIASVKTLSTELRPGVLDKFGLSAAIEWQCEEFSRRSGIGCQCNVPREELALAPEISTALFRILQEALTNVVRHSQADHVIIDLTVADATVSLTISDNGRGITRDEISAPTSLGLLGMRERVEFLGGSLTITGRPSQGSIVSVKTPLTGVARNDGRGK